MQSTTPQTNASQFSPKPAGVAKQVGAGWGFSRTIHFQVKNTTRVRLLGVGSEILDEVPASQGWVSYSPDRVPDRLVLMGPGGTTEIRVNPF